MRYERLNDKSSRRKVVSCVTPCRIQLIGPSVTGISEKEN